MAKKQPDNPVIQEEKGGEVFTISFEEFVRSVNIYPKLDEIKEKIRDEVAKQFPEHVRGVLQVRFVAPLLDLEQLDNFPAPLVADKKAAEAAKAADEST